MDFLEVRILGSDEFIAGSKGSLRILILNHRQSLPVANALVRLTLIKDQMKRILYSGRTDQNGTLNLSFTVPRNFEGNATMEIVVDSKLGSKRIEESIKIKSGYTVYLTTDKPIYQPAQIIHIRTLSLERPNLTPVGKKEMLIEIEDAKGNKVFKKRLMTDHFGVASVDFQLADEVNFGDYKITATLTNEITEKVVQVKRYVLPKFAVKFSTDKDFYLPGEKVKGRVSAGYFFGKPVAFGNVTISIKKFDIGFDEVQRITGKTDKDGNFTFEYDLPGYFTGLPFEQGNAFIRFDLEITDGAEHTEKKSETRRVVKDPILIQTVLEGNILKPGLKNRLIILTTYPDGKPAPGSITIKYGKTVKVEETDQHGWLDYEFFVEKEKVEIDISAKDVKGNTSKVRCHFAGEMRDGIVLRTNKPLYKVGESCSLRVYATKKKGRCYLDLIRDHQTILTRSFEIVNGEGAYDMTLSNDLTGTLWVRAYMVTSGSDIIKDTRVIFVDPANDLRITITPNKETFKPGEEGWIDFLVQNKANLPVVACLGVAIVDEAVFALSELRPGLEKIYFLLEEEIMHPRYEIHGFDPLLVIKEPGQAEFLFAQAEPKKEFGLNINTYDDTREKIVEAYGRRISDDYYKISNALGQFYSKHNRYPKKEEGIKVLFEEGFLKRRELLDPWGTSYEIKLEDWGGFTMLSYGPDKKKGTPDDLTPQIFWERRGFRDEIDGAKMVMPLPAMAPPQAEAVASATETTARKKPGAEPRVREYFPETMLFEPMIVTTADGHAKLSLKWPDSITRWRLSLMASSRKGELGSKDQGMVVFQDFFIDIDLPVSLTRGDEVSIPVAIYNYLPKPQKIKLVLEESDWFDILEEAEIERTLQKDEVSVVYFPIRVKKIGFHKMTVRAYGSVMSDAIARTVEVIPEGKEMR
ncbi:MAG: alpha-2-macroglobulin family protein, partial [candidate division WOR-3 bacterium]